MALNIFERTDGAMGVTTASARTNLAMVYQKLGRNDDALRLQQQAYDALVAVFGSDHPEVIDVVSSLGSLYLQRGELDLALKYTRRALRAYESALGPQHEQLIEPLSTLCWILLERWHLVAALNAARRALSIGEASFGATHPDLATPLLCLGDSLLHLGQSLAAVPVAERTLALLGGQTHPDSDAMAGAQFLLARALRQSGRESLRAYDLAEEARKNYAQRPGNKQRLRQVRAWMARSKNPPDRHVQRDDT